MESDSSSSYHDNPSGGGGGSDFYFQTANPQADMVDVSQDQGSPRKKANKLNPKNEDASSETDLDNLAELVPAIKDRRSGSGTHERGGRVENVEGRQQHKSTRDNSGRFVMELGDDAGERTPRFDGISMEDMLLHPKARISNAPHKGAQPKSVPLSSSRLVSVPTKDFNGMNPEPGMSSSDSAKDQSYGDLEDYPYSEHVADGEGFEVQDEQADAPPEFMNMSSAQSISTATQTHEVRMPMYLPTFKPATGCTNASDFIVRCFVARLRSGITVVKHGRSRWCKSRLRVLHIHPDGRSLSWKPAEGEPPTSKRPPKLDLSTCLEVRHAWSPDPQNPMYTGTPILRQKCEAANAHKSFALIFKSRTVDITAVTADQCKVLMEGFSALCFRLQVANLAGRTGTKKGSAVHPARPMPEEDGVSTTASATLTNRSTPRVGA